MRKHLLTTLALMLLASAGLLAQITTSSLKGFVTDSKGEPLPGASILATHTPSGTSYGALTNAEGQYNIPGMRIGGPYSVKVTFVGFKEQTSTDVYLSLGVAADVNV